MLRTRVSTFFHRVRRRQRGQVLVLTALMFSVFGGMTATAVDLGSFMADRRDLQNAADAIALAASLDLPDSADAQAAANQWALNNGIDPNSMTVTIIPQSLPAEPNPKVRVELSREHGFTFARLIGISSATVGAQAAAIKTSPAGGAGMVPLSVTQDALDDIAFGTQVTLKHDGTDLAQGNSGPVRIDGPGSGNCTSSDRYCTGVKFGAENTVCADGADLTYCSGSTEVDTEPGVNVGGTREAIEYRMDNTDTQCSQFEDPNGVFEDDPTTSDPDVYRIKWECNPFLEGGYSSLQVVIVPVICVELPDGSCEGNFDSCTGTCEVTIVDFALFFLEGFANPGSCQGNDCEIIGRFVQVNQNMGLLAGTFDPESFNQFVRLVE